MRAILINGTSPAAGWFMFDNRLPSCNISNTSSIRRVNGLLPIPQLKRYWDECVGISQHFCTPSPSTISLECSKRNYWGLKVQWRTMLHASCWEHSDIGPQVGGVWCLIIVCCLWSYQQDQDCCDLFIVYIPYTGYWTVTDYGAWSVNNQCPQTITVLHI